MLAGQRDLQVEKTGQGVGFWARGELGSLSRGPEVAPTYADRENQVASAAGFSALMRRKGD